jgi:CheY-like chemotaxis protein
VIDTGPGIPADLHHEIFEEFFQLGNPERDRTKGLGLGLSIVKRTAEILQHELIVRSQVNRGSTFGVEVPLVKTEPVRFNAAPCITPDPARFAGMFVVIIDDDKETRFAIQMLCTQWQCHVVAAGGLHEALDRLQEHLRSPDLIITDYCLQNGETGVDTITRVRQVAQEPIPAIIVTGDLSVRPLLGSDGAGVELLYKPINAERLWMAADKLLKAAAAANVSP